MTQLRSNNIDFYRGLCILMMIFIHGATYLPFPLKQIVQLVLDVVAEGFLLLAGLMIGWRLIPVYIKSKKTAIEKILKRAGQILLLHYFLILTIDLPLRLFLQNDLNNTGELFHYLLNIFLWQEQPYILDILPIFVTMFAITPVFLELYCRRLEIVVYFGSALIFIIGMIWPYAISVKDSATFPAIQWQIYFIIGVFLGSRYNKISQLNHRILRRWAYGIITFFIILVYFRHGMGYTPEWLVEFLSPLRFNIQKFPISPCGFVFSASLLAAASLSSVLHWPNLSGIYILRVFISTLGRNSLLAFSLHVYFNYLISTIDTSFAVPPYVLTGMLLLDVVAIFLLIACWEKFRGSYTASLSTQKA
jgi:hypothetical protein